MLLCCWSGLAQNNQHLTQQGSVSFFSYTPVENIRATNNLVYSLLDLDKEQVAVSMLMRAFTFEKALMQEHFNESYIESDLYPRATFAGQIQNFNARAEQQTCMISGQFTLHGVSQAVEVKTVISKNGDSYIFSGELQVPVADYDIKVPVLLRPNIAKTIAVKFNFEYAPYESE